MKCLRRRSSFACGNVARHISQLSETHANADILFHKRMKRIYTWQRDSFTLYLFEAYFLRCNFVFAFACECTLVFVSMCAQHCLYAVSARIIIMPRTHKVPNTHAYW